MSRTIHPPFMKEDTRWEVFEDAVHNPYVVLRWGDVETVCDTVEYLCVDADPLRESLRHESGESVDRLPRDFTLTHEEIEHLHEFARDALDVVDEAYDVRETHRQFIEANVEQGGADAPSDDEWDKLIARNKLFQLRTLTEVALELDVQLEVG